MTDNDIFCGVGVEIRLKSPDDFLKIRETLTRIGVPSRQEKTLYQSCHILHKRRRYVILHFKELFKLDNKISTLTLEDIGRRNRIVTMLEEWGLLEIIDIERCKEPKAPINHIKILSFEDKRYWKLEAKYSIGMKRK